MTTTVPPPTAPPAPPRAPPGLPSAGPLSPDPPRRWVAWRLLLGCAVTLLCAMGIGAAFVLDQVHTLRDALSLNSALSLPSQSLAPAGWGDPETLLLVGNDQRSLTQYYHVAVPPLANEMLLVRLDPSKPYISMMSIPRELEVTINPPGRAPYTNRLNSAYTYGIGTLVATIKRVLGLRVNHVIVTTFGKFKRAVDQMGCVYSTVDQRYYHVNVPGGEQYQEINLEPGYQNLCGAEALEFVSYRHTDTSLVRDARDQSFLLDVKKQYGPTLVGNIGGFEHIFGQAVQTDSGLHSSTELLNLIGTLISSAGLTVRQVPFQTNLVPAAGTSCSCVTSTPQQIAASVHAFLVGGSPPAKKSTAAVARAVQHRNVVAHLPLVPTGPTELGQARAAESGLPFPYEYPRVQDRGGSGIPADLRSYQIRAPGGTSYPIYAQVFSAGQLGQFYDVQGTPWIGAPLLRDPQQTVRVGGRTYQLYYESQHLNLVAWSEYGAAYWVRNSLTNAVPNGELLAIAQETRPVSAVPATGTRASRQHVNLKDASLPVYTTPTQSTDLRRTLGSLGGLLVLAAVPLLAIPLIKRRRELGALRTELRTSSAREAQLAAVLTASGVPAVPLPALPAAPLPGGGMRTTVGTSAGRPASGSSKLGDSGRRVHPPRRRSRRGPLLGAAVAVAAAGALGAFLLTSHTNTGVPQSGAAAAAPSIPPVPVAVLNATSTPGAAGRMAGQLRGRGAKVGSVGNLNGWQRSGLWVLYGAGKRVQALSVARLLAPRAATIAPIEASVQAAGNGASLVVVIG